MKKFYNIIILILIISCFTTPSYAQDEHSTFSFSFESVDISVSGIITQNEAYNIAYTMYCNEQNIDMPVICAPCDISGHYYKYTTITTKEHKVYSSNPRCVFKRYSVESCTKCSATLSTTLIESYRINCCWQRNSHSKNTKQFFVKKKGALKWKNLSL